MPRPGTKRLKAAQPPRADAGAQAVQGGVDGFNLYAEARRRRHGVPQDAGGTAERAGRSRHVMGVENQPGTVARRLLEGAVDAALVDLAIHQRHGVEELRIGGTGIDTGPDAAAGAEMALEPALPAQ